MEEIQFRLAYKTPDKKRNIMGALENPCIRESLR
jgi:hypothetical protein